MIVFDPVEADYMSASRANYLAQMRRWRGRTRSLTIVMAVVALMGAAGWFIDGHLDPFWPAWLIMLVVPLPVAVAANLLLTPRQLRRLFKQRPGYREPMQVNWPDQGFSIECSMTSHRLAWKRLVRWRETRDSFLMYITDTGCVFVPKRVLSSEQTADFRCRLTEARR